MWETQTFTRLFSDDDTWEPVSNLDCPEIISLYEKNKKAAAKKAEAKSEPVPPIEPKPVKRAKTDDSDVVKKKNTKKVFIVPVNVAVFFIIIT